MTRTASTPCQHCNVNAADLRARRFFVTTAAIIVPVLGLGIIAALIFNLARQPAIKDFVMVDPVSAVCFEFAPDQYLLQIGFTGVDKAHLLDGVELQSSSGMTVTRVSLVDQGRAPWTATNPPTAGELASFKAVPGLDLGLGPLAPAQRTLALVLQTESAQAAGMGLTFRTYVGELSYEQEIGMSIIADGAACRVKVPE